VSSILAERVDIVVGVDTHTDTHTAVILTPVGAVVAEQTVTADPRGVAQVMSWVDELTAGQRRAWVIDGARSHGIGLVRQLRAAGETLIEAPRTTRRRGGKSDTLDAAHFGRAALAARHGAVPRIDGDREALRILHVCRRHYTDTRTATVNLFKSLILTADDDLRGRLRGLSSRKQIRQAAHLATTGPFDTLTRVRCEHLRALATQIITLDRLLADNLKQIRDLVGAVCPALLEQPGVGPVTAAIAYTTWSHHGRCRSEAAFAALAGVNPIPASSGRTTRHRLNRGGDRTLNSALHIIAKVRLRMHPPTRDYLARRTAEGRNRKEINRCIKRYIARQLFRIMQAAA
jgi:transposase